MQVGDLVRLMVSNHLLDTERLNNQLAVIVRHNEAACNPWKVKVINGVVLWLKSYELEKL